MLQAILLTFLLAELTFYVWLGLALSARGFSVFAMSATLLLIALVWRLSHALASFTVTSALRLRDRRVLPWGNSLAALGNELAARFVCFNWSQPFPGLTVGADPIGAKDGVPILLVHGYVCNRGLWVALRQTLAAAGLGPIYADTFTPVFGGIDVFAAKLDARIEAICIETGADKVMIVAHSMGGLAVRAYMAQTAQTAVSRIAKLVTLGSPHHGSQVARLGIGMNAGQMCEQSEWLQTLESREAADAIGGLRKRPATLSIYTLNDDLVYPPESSVLEWAENVPVSAVGHIGLVFSAPVARRVIAHLR